MPIFEYDNNKSQKNQSKHGIDFETAQALWNDPNYIELPAKKKDEDRWMIVGMMADNYWTAFITYRGDNTRIISVRRSRIKEVQFYES